MNIKWVLLVLAALVVFGGLTLYLFNQNQNFHVTVIYYDVIKIEAWSQQPGQKSHYSTLSDQQRSDLLNAFFMAKSISNKPGSVEDSTYGVTIFLKDGTTIQLNNHLEVRRTLHNRPVAYVLEGEELDKVLKSVCAIK
ncbi:hypothetical protein LJC42_06775 [Eubacteriales bacterium OttesenSCG-928-K08]|nr:hypothetical protein [Eubacteriales bacterium OttesenSCG-928-K08]